MAKNKEKARALILAGEVLVNDIKLTKASALVIENADIRLKKKPPYVSRGGLKLEKALEQFKIDPNGKVCLDIGSSAGGFTDCLLQRNAKKVYAIDSGTNQLHYKIRTNPKVAVFEKTNARYLSKEFTEKNIEIVVIDVSFISITKILKHIVDSFLNNHLIHLVTLIKPQFELKRRLVPKGGIILNKDSHLLVLKQIFSFCMEHQLAVLNACFSPIKGTKGNQEYFFHLVLNTSILKEKKIDEINEEDLKKLVFEERKEPNSSYSSYLKDETI